MNEKYQNPQYSSQRMITVNGAKPTVAPWRYGLTVLLSRNFAMFLSVVDGAISYRGLRNWDMAIFEAACVASFIAIFQACVAIAVTSGQPVGSRFQERFFSDMGVIGIVKRCLGVFLVILGMSFYLVDIVSNYVAFTGNRWIPLTGEDAMRSLVMLSLACAFSLGDELLHLVADESAIAEELNRVRHQGQTYEAHLMNRYQAGYIKTAEPTADQLGAEHGGRWRPRGDIE